MSRLSLTRRLDALESPGDGDCRDPWHDEAGKLFVAIENIDTRQAPDPPRCPACGAEPDLIIHVAYVDDWRSETWDYKGRPVKDITGDASINDL